MPEPANLRVATSTAPVPVIGGLRQGERRTSSSGRGLLTGVALALALARRDWHRPARGQHQSICQ